jgi:lysophospholipase L1-like esterase
MRRLAIALGLLLIAFLPALFRSRPGVTASGDGIFRAAILGDSVAHGAGDESGRGIARWLDAELARLRIPAAASVNFGVNGARTRVVLARLRDAQVRAVLRTADAVILSIGGNDLYGDSMARLLTTLWPERAMDRALGRVDRVVAGIRRASPAAHIYVLGLYDPYRRPFLARHVNRWDARLIERFADAPDVTVIRIADLLDRAGRLSPRDHFHPGAAGYAAIAARIAGAL